MLPASILTEAMAQAGAVLILAKPENRSRLIYFVGIDRVRYRRPVVAGDQVRLEATVVRLRSRMGSLRGVARVDGSVVCEGQMTFALGEPTRPLNPVRRAGRITPRPRPLQVRRLLADGSRVASLLPAASVWTATRLRTPISGSIRRRDRITVDGRLVSDNAERARDRLPQARRPLDHARGSGWPPHGLRPPGRRGPLGLSRGPSRPRHLRAAHPDQRPPPGRAAHRSRGPRPQDLPRAGHRAARRGVPPRAARGRAARAGSRHAPRARARAGCGARGDARGSRSCSPRGRTARSAGCARRSATTSSSSCACGWEGSISGICGRASGGDWRRGRSVGWLWGARAPPTGATGGHVDSKFTPVVLPPLTTTPMRSFAAGT